MIHWWVLIPWALLYIMQELRYRDVKRDYEAMHELCQWWRARYTKHVDKCWKEHVDIWS